MAGGTSGSGVQVAAPNVPTPGVPTPSAPQLTPQITGTPVQMRNQWQALGGMPQNPAQFGGLNRYTQMPGQVMRNMYQPMVYRNPMQMLFQRVQQNPALLNQILPGLLGHGGGGDGGAGGAGGGGDGGGNGVGGVGDGNGGPW